MDDLKYKSIVNFAEEMLGEGNPLSEWQKELITKAYNNYKETGHLIVIPRWSGYSLTITCLNYLIALYESMKGEENAKS